MRTWFTKRIKELIKVFVVEFLWKVLKALAKAAKLFLEELKKIISDIIKQQH